MRTVFKVLGLINRAELDQKVFVGKCAKFKVLWAAPQTYLLIFSSPFILESFELHFLYFPNVGALNGDIKVFASKQTSANNLFILFVLSIMVPLIEARQLHSPSWQQVLCPPGSLLPGAVQESPRVPVSHRSCQPAVALKNASVSTMTHERRWGNWGKTQRGASPLRPVMPHMCKWKESAGKDCLVWKHLAHTLVSPLEWLKFELV